MCCDKLSQWIYIQEQIKEGGIWQWYFSVLEKKDPSRWIMMIKRRKKQLE